LPARIRRATCKVVLVGRGGTIDSPKGISEGDSASPGPRLSPALFPLCLPRL
jgi:hypothetical protein